MKIKNNMSILYNFTESAYKNLECLKNEIKNIGKIDNYIVCLLRSHENPNIFRILDDFKESTKFERKFYKFYQAKRFDIYKALNELIEFKKIRIMYNGYFILCSTYSFEDLLTYLNVNDNKDNSNQKVYSEILETMNSFIITLKDKIKAVKEIENIAIILKSKTLSNIYKIVYSMDDVKHYEWKYNIYTMIDKSNLHNILLYLEKNDKIMIIDDTIKTKDYVQFEKDIISNMVDN